MNYNLFICFSHNYTGNPILVLLIGGMFFGFIVLVVGLSNISLRNKLKEIGNKAQGTILKFNSMQNDKGEIVQYPVVSFLTKDNKLITEQAKKNLDPNKYKVDDVVKILYNTNSPTDFMIYNMWYMIKGVVLTLSGLLLLILFIYLYNIVPEVINLG